MWVIFLNVQVKTEDPEVDRKSVCSKKSSASPVPPSSAVSVLDAHHITAKTSPSSTAALGIPAVGGTALYNPEIELSTDTEDSSSDLAGETGKAFDKLLLLSLCPKDLQWFCDSALWPRRPADPVSVLQWYVKIWLPSL